MADATAETELIVGSVITKLRFQELAFHCKPLPNNQDYIRLIIASISQK